MNIVDLEALILDLTNSTEGRELIIMHDKVLSSDKFRWRYMAMMQVPTYH